MAALRIKKLSRTFRGPGDAVVAVCDFDLDMSGGELVVLVGPSGCGKSTTLRMIAGLDVPTTGRVFLDGQDVTHLEPKDRDVALVFQNYALYPHMSAFENMAFGLRLRKTPPDEIARRVHDAAHWLGIEQLLHRLPANLSGGEQQRVALGRALVRRPRLFLFDEPLANLDPSLRLATRAEIKRLHHEFKTTTIHVTHDQEEALALADRLVVMCAGRVQQVGTPQEIYNQPANKFVAGFFGMPPMRFVPGILRTDDAATQVEIPLGRFPIRIADSLRHIANQVTVGFRAEDCTFVASGSGGAADQKTDAATALSAPATIEIVEPLGHCFQLGLRTDSGLSFISRAPIPQNPVVGTKGKINLRTQNAHLFAAGDHGTRLN